MRVHSKLVLDIATGKVLEACAFEYHGPRAQAKGSEHSTTTNQLPAFAQPYAEKFLKTYSDQAFDANGQPIGMPEGMNMQTAGFAQPQWEGMYGINAITPYAQSGANLGLNQAMSTLQGAYLGPESNPWLGRTYDAAARSMTDNYNMATAPGLMTAAQRAGQFGSSAMDESMAYSRFGLGENLNNLATSIYGGNYAQERQNMMNMQNMLPGAVQGLYAPSQAQLGVGAMQQEQTQQEYDTQYQNAAQKAQWPFNILSGFGGAIGQAAGGGGTSHVSGDKQGMFGSVICTVLHDFGLMDDATFKADCEFGASLPPQTVRGYHRWAIPVAKAMRRSRLITALIEPVALSWASTMRARVEGRSSDERLFGRLLLRFGLPFCSWLGRERAAYRTVQS
jgi:hypothetical protein